MVEIFVVVLSLSRLSDFGSRTQPIEGTNLGRTKPRSKQLGMTERKMDIERYLLNPLGAIMEFP